MNNAWSLEKKANMSERMKYNWDMAIALCWHFYTFACFLAGIFCGWFEFVDIIKRVAAILAIIAYLSVLYIFIEATVAISLLVFVGAAIIIAYFGGKTITEVRMWESSYDRY